MPLTRSRRWLRFSLRTMFVVVTVWACWLAYQLDWIRQRNAAIGRLVVNESYSPSLGRAPSMLWLFGEPAYDTLVYLPDWADDDSVAAFKVLGKPMPERPASETDVQRLEALFPESFVRSLIP